MLVELKLKPKQTTDNNPSLNGNVRQTTMI